MQSFKIAFFIRSLQKGGAEKQSLLLSDYLSKKHKTHLFVLHKGESELLKKYPTSAEVHYLSGNSIYSLFKLFKLLKQHNINVLINFLPSNNIVGLIVGFFAGVKKRYAGVRGTKLKNPVIKRFLQKTIVNRFSNGIISNSYAAREVYIKYGYRSDSFEVIHNIFESTEYSKIYNPCKTITILSVGRFVTEKEYDVAIKSIHCIREKYPDILIKYKIVGYGKGLNSIIELINQFNLSGIVEIFDGQQLSPEQFYMDADIYLLTSKFEGMPNTIMEAMDFMLPVVTTNAGDAKYLVRNGVNGFVTDIGNIKQITEKMSLLIFDEDLRKQFGANSKQILKGNFSHEVIIEKLVNVISE